MIFLPPPPPLLLLLLLLKEEVALLSPCAILIFPSSARADEERGGRGVKGAGRVVVNESNARREREVRPMSFDSEINFSDDSDDNESKLAYRSSA